MKNLILLLAVPLFLSSGCRRVDIREITIDIPGLAAVTNKAAACDAAQKKITDALMTYSGVRDYSGAEKNNSYIVWDKENPTRLTLRFDSLQIAEMNILKAIEEAGYAVTYPELKNDAPAGYINARKPEVKN